MIQVCPKCGKEGKFGYFDSADQTGVIAIFTHKTGKFEKVKDVLGGERLVEIKERHYITLDELKQTAWFEEWKKNYNSEMEKGKIDFDKLWKQEYWKSVEKEHEEDYK